jgi:beta-alanine--pyruvate transaminase
MSYDVNSLEAHWMPFSANRDFKKDPRIVVKSEGMYMWDYKGGEIIDGSSALFCTPLGHGRREIAEAVYQQMLANDYTPHFQLGHQARLTLPSVFAGFFPISLTMCFSPIPDPNQSRPRSRSFWPISVPQVRHSGIG